VEEINYAVGNSSVNSWSNYFKLNLSQDNFIHFGLCINRKNKIAASGNSLSYLLISQEIAQKIQKLISKKNWEDDLSINLNELFLSYDEYEISASLIFLDSNNLTIINYGLINAFLKRNEKIIKLIDGVSNEIKKAKGELIENDEVLVTNSKFDFEVIKEDLLSSEIFIKFNFVKKFDFVVHNYQEEEEKEKKEIENLDKNNFLSRLKFNRNNSPKIAIKEDTIDLFQKRKKALTPFFGLILLILLIVSITVGINKKRKEEIKDDISQSVLEIQNLLSDAKNSSDSFVSRGLLTDAKNKANELLLKYPDNTEAIDIKNSVELGFSEIAGIIEKNAEVYLDLGLIANNFKGDGMAMNAEYMTIFDNTENKIVSIETESKKTKIISESDLIPNLLKISNFDKRTFVLSFDGIREVTNSVELFIKPDSWESSNVLFKSFAGNVYIVDKNNNKIYRYIGVRGGFLEKEDWLAPGIVADFSDVLDMAIDGSIWVLYSDGDVWKYLQGVPQKLSISYPESISDNLKFFTDENYDNFYVLDSDNGKIFEFDKNGEYKKEYSSNDLRQAQNFVVSQKTQKIIFLKDAKLWEIKM